MTASVNRGYACGTNNPSQYIRLSDIAGPSSSLDGECDSRMTWRSLERKLQTTPVEIS